MVTTTRTDASPLKVVVLGASGMLGSQLVRTLSASDGVSVVGTVRDRQSLPLAFVEEFGGFLVEGVDVTDDGARRSVVSEADVIVNAVGVIKQTAQLDDHNATVRLNALLPHQLANDCAEYNARFIHVSTDCVFSGRRGGYSEQDVPDPVDFYGRSKLLGEVAGAALTLRTSIVGHELHRHASLIDWFLSQPQTTVCGFANAIYSGVTTNEFARLLVEVVLDRPDLQGLYHVASEPISKFDLLNLVAAAYGWGGEIVPFEDFRLDRSMVAHRLQAETGYRPPEWSEMIRDMHDARPAWALEPTQEETPA